MFQIVNHAMYTCIKFSVRSRKTRENVAEQNQCTYIHKPVCKMSHGDNK